MSGAIPKALVAETVRFAEPARLFPCRNAET